MTHRSAKPLARLRAAMRRWILILFACLLPLQLSLASAAAVCGHESACTPHFGHHEHKHADAASDEAATASSTSGTAHPDCQTCHAVGIAVARTTNATLLARTVDAPAPWTAVAWADPPVDEFLRPPATDLV